MLATGVDWRLFSNELANQVIINIPTVAALCEQADKLLFRSIKHTPIHPLCRLLPPERNTPYLTRARLHNYAIPSKVPKIDECSYCVLYKELS